MSDEWIMKYLRKVAAGGLLGIAVFALHAAGPVRDDYVTPDGESGAWLPLEDVPAGKVTVHVPDFSAAIPRTSRGDKPIPFRNERELSDGFLAGKSPAGSRRARSSGRADEEGMGNGFLDSWLLPEEGGAAESTGWGWLADSVSASESEANAAGDRASAIRGLFGRDRSFSGNMDAIPPGRMELDPHAGERMLDYDLRELGQGNPEGGGSENGWSVSPWR